MSLDPGTLKDRITIQRHTQSKDEWGTLIPESIAWEDVCKVWANVKYLSGSESIKADADVSVVKASVRIRWRAGVTAGMRVVHGADTLDIEAVLPGAGRQHVDLVCKRVT